jgi:hypothetical protein
VDEAEGDSAPSFAGTPQRTRNDVLAKEQRRRGPVLDREKRYAIILAESREVIRPSYSDHS